jgi:putative transposase
MSLTENHAVRTGTYFFTVRLDDPASDLLARHIDLFRQSVALARQRWPFVIEAAVILPDRTHMIWTLPQRDNDYGLRWRLIKTTFERHLPARTRKALASAGQRVWQRRYWEQPVTSSADLSSYLDMIHTAPVRAGLVRHGTDWRYSSFFRGNAGSLHTA